MFNYSFSRMKTDIEILEAKKARFFLIERIALATWLVTSFLLRAYYCPCAYRLFFIIEDE